MDRPATPFEALQTAVDHVGSQSAMARLCGIGQPAVWKWLQSGKRLPAEHVLTVEAATGVSKHLLRPDIYPIAASDLDECYRMEATQIDRNRGQDFQREAQA